MGHLRNLGWLAVVCLVIGAVPFSTRSDDSEALKGWYQITDERITPEAANVTLHLMMFNLGDVDLEGLNLRLAGADFDDPPRVVQDGASVAARSRRQFAVELQLSAGEHQRWRLGAQPRLYLARPTADGNTIATKIDLIEQEFEISPSGSGGGAVVEIMRQSAAGEAQP